MTKFHLFSQDSVRLETSPTGGVRKSYWIEQYMRVRGVCVPRRLFFFSHQGWVRFGSSP